MTEQPGAAVTGDPIAPGWAPALAAGAAGRWAAVDEHHVHLWSGHRLERTVDLPTLLGGGPPRFLAAGTLLAGRYAIEPASGEAHERLPLDGVISAYDPQADPDRLVVRAVAWAADGAHALLFAQYPPTRVKGARDEVRPGGMLALVDLGAGTGAGAEEVRVLERGRFLDVGALAGDRWLCAGGRGLRCYDPAAGDAAVSVETGTGVSALATVGDLVVAGLATGELLHLRLPGEEPVRRPRHAAVVDAVALSADATLLASGDRDGHLVVERVADGEVAIDASMPGRVDGLCFLDGDRLAVAVGGPERQLRQLSVSGER